MKRPVAFHHYQAEDANASLWPEPIGGFVSAETQRSKRR